MSGRRRAEIILGTLALGLLTVGAGFLIDQRAQGPIWRGLWSITGEEGTLGQVRGLYDYVWKFTRAQPQTDYAGDIPLADVNPFGVNTFLQQEVEPAKRKRQVEMIADAGFAWIRQEFPWEDIEIHGRGDFVDRRNDPMGIDAWAKYDHIVDLAERYDLNVIVRLSNPPAWSRQDGDARGPFAPPDDPADFVNYARAVAERYAGRLRYFQIWNEPNIYPEWGEAEVSPADYTELLCRTYDVLKAIDPDIVVITAALAPTVAPGGRDLNDLTFLQLMYEAGAKDCFDVLSVQGYGLFSGPTDHRSHAITLNVARHEWIRDIMLTHGDGEKAIWLAEAAWNPVPDDLAHPDKLRYGQVTEEQRARWLPLLYERAREEWPWVGVIALWYFKPASDLDAGKPEYYFRLVEPGFTPLPAFEAMRDYIGREPFDG